MPSITIKTEVTDETLRNLLCDAFEGGASFWCRILNSKLAAGLKLKDFKKGGSLYNDDWPPVYLIPFTDGCCLILEDVEENKTYQLNKESLYHGIQVMSDKYPKHFADVMNENDDANTGDIFLQCCLFGEEIYA